MRLHTILGQFMKDKEADEVVIAIVACLRDEHGPEFVRLVQRLIHEVK